MVGTMFLTTGEILASIATYYNNMKRPDQDVLNPIMALPFYIIAGGLLCWKGFVLMQRPWFLVPNFTFYAFFNLFAGIFIL